MRMWLPVLLVGCGGSKELASLEDDLADLQDEVDSLTTQLADAQAIIDGQEARLASLEAATEGIAGLAGVLTLSDGDVVLSGANLYIQSGSGSTTGEVNGKGNLILGYDEDNGDEKTGSHNLIVGHNHSYTSYGGAALGQDHTLSAPMALR